MVEMLDNPVALHIRRGDYIINHANHHNLSMEYYAEALKEFPDRQVIIFSDDPNWCHVQDIFEGDRFLVAEGNGPYHDLYLMSQCNDFIIANSTFSWWGAWLADKGTVIAPNKWFGLVITMTWNLLTVAFGSSKYMKGQRFLERQAEKYGVNHIGFNETDMKVGHCDLYFWFAWKPYFILEAMKGLKEGDKILCLDALDIVHPDIFKYVDEVMGDDACLLPLFP